MKEIAEMVAHIPEPLPHTVSLKKVLGPLFHPILKMQLDYEQKQELKL